MIFLVIILIYFGISAYCTFKMANSFKITVYFGKVGCGKSTVAALLAKKQFKKGKSVFSNFAIKGAYKLDVKTLGVNHYENCHIIIDEAGLDFNNRNFKSFTQTSLNFFKLHRHYRTKIDIFSQVYDDFDKKIRDLAQKLYIVKPSLIPFFIVAVPVSKKIGVDEMTKQIIDEYSIDPIYLLGRKYFFAPSAWKMFDSYTAPPLNPFTPEPWETQAAAHVPVSADKETTATVTQ